MKKYIPEENILLVDKPTGITSSNLVQSVRRILHIEKAGHAGTLDPLATGLMIVGLNKGTKKLDHFLKLPKTYEVGILFGTKTATGDIQGEITEHIPVTEIDEEKLASILKNLNGTVSLPVPAYSAIKIDGQRLYKLARAGMPVTPPIRAMEIKELRQISLTKKGEGYILELELRVGSGTYIRSIAEEIGRLLDIPATVAKLRRTSIGEWFVEDALTLEKLEKEDVYGRKELE